MKTIMNRSEPVASKTITKTGLHIQAYRDERIYEKGKKVSDKEMNKLALRKADELEKWNYTIEPRVSCQNVSNITSIDNDRQQSLESNHGLSNIIIYLPRFVASAGIVFSEIAQKSRQRMRI